MHVAKAKADSIKERDKMAEARAIVFFADGFEEVEAITVVDILRRAEIPTRTVSIMDKKEVVGAHRVPVVCEGILAEELESVRQAEMLILPGGGKGTENLGNHAALGELLKAFKADGKWLAAVCAAPTVLGKHGLLAGETAVCYPGCEPQLTGATLGDAPVVRSGKIITSKGPGTSAAFALALVGVLKSEALAAEIQEQMIYCLAE